MLEEWDKEARKTGKKNKSKINNGGSVDANLLSFYFIY